MKTLKVWTKGFFFFFFFLSLLNRPIFLIVISLLCFIIQMLEGLVRKVALDLDVEDIAKAAKASKEAKIAEVGVDIELLTK